MGYELMRRLLITIALLAMASISHAQVLQQLTLAPTKTIIGDATTYLTLPYVGYMQVNGSFGSLQVFPDRMELNPATFPNDTTITWNYGAPGCSSGGVCGFLAEDFGNAAGLGQQPIPAAMVNQLTSLTETHNLTFGGGSPDGYDVIDDMFIYDVPTQVTRLFELDLALHTNTQFASFIAAAPNQYGTTTISGINWTVACYCNVGPPANGLVLWMPTSKADVASGTLDLLAMLNFEKSQGIITGNEVFTGFSLGGEPVLGSGSLTYTSFSGAVTYGFPGDVVAPSAKLDISTRSYTTAYATGSNASGILKRASDSTTDTINILSNGNFDAATANTFCTSTTCSWTTATDQSGNGNNCTQSTTADQPVRVSNNSPFSGYSESLGFTGSAPALNCGTGAGEASTVTYIAWIYPTSFPAAQNIIGGTSGNGDLEWALDSFGDQVLIVQDITNIGTANKALPVNAWSCVGVSYNSGTGAYAFYVNGIQTATGTNVQSPTSQGRTIGNSSLGSPFRGDIAEVLMYNSVLTNVQVAGVCNQTLE